MIIKAQGIQISPIKSSLTKVRSTALIKKQVYII